MFLVSGITGHVGGAAAQKLLDEGHTVRALARDPQKAASWAEKGVEVHQGDFNDPAALASALEGVEGAYLMLPPIMAPGPGFPEAQAMVDSFLKALGQTPPPRLVLLSSIGSEKDHGLGLITSTHILEEVLSDLPFPTVFVRAGAFLENNLPVLGQAASTGFFDTFYTPTDRLLPMIASEDIGKEVAHLLIEGWSGKKIIELGSPYSADDLAQALTGVFGQPITARSIPREQWNPILSSMGMPERTVELYIEMIDGSNSGWIDFGVPGTEQVEGTLTPAEFFAKASQ